MDLTADVNFFILETILSRSKICSASIVTQRDFLIGNGILDRFNMLCNKFKSDSRFVYDLYTRVNRLLEAEGMGTIYKAMIIRNKK